MMRNPRDVFTSYSHFSRMASFLVSPGTQTEFLNKFLDGKGIQYMDCLCIAFVHFYPLCLFSLLGLIFNPETGIRSTLTIAHSHKLFFISNLSDFWLVVRSREGLAVCHRTAHHVHLL